MDKISTFINHEHQYLNCFCESQPHEDYTKFKDEQLPDKYYHNCIQINKPIPETELKALISRGLRSAKGHFMVGMIQGLTKEAVENISTSMNKPMELEHIGCYVLDTKQVPAWSTRKDCDIIPYTPKNLGEICLFYLENDGATVGSDFAIRRAQRKALVFAENPQIDNYLLVYDGLVVGVCELFIADGFAKIESFAILEDYQRQGFGTTLLAYLVRKAMGEGAETIYLLADEEDTPKNMYEKMGFAKVFEFFNLTWIEEK